MVELHQLESIVLISSIANDWSNLVTLQDFFVALMKCVKIENDLFLNLHSSLMALFFLYSKLFQEVILVKLLEKKVLLQEHVVAEVLTDFLV